MNGCLGQSVEGGEGERLPILPLPVDHASALHPLCLERVAGSFTSY